MYVSPNARPGEVSPVLKPFSALLGSRLRGYVQVDARKLRFDETAKLYEWINLVVWTRCVPGTVVTILRD